MSLSSKIFCRYSDLDFANNYRTKYESTKIEGLGRTVGGYLVWRRTLILPCTRAAVRGLPSSSVDSWLAPYFVRRLP